jgi:pyruvate,water dikinase
MITVASLETPGACDAGSFGNKAANLAIAKQAGLPVPNGLCVSDDGEPTADDVRPLLSTLSPPLAVRSSSHVEDSPGSAFPGVFETVLGVSTVEQILDAVHRVRASAHGESVQAYLSGRPMTIRMAVLIQELVPASSAGVAFSRDPVTGARTVIIESGLGLGKSVVDGEITPDSHEFTHDSGMIRKSVGRKAVRYDHTDRLTRTAVPAADAARFAISDEQAREVCALTVAAERIFRYAIDIEWAFDRAGKLWLVQARPITTLPKERSDG